MEHNYVGTEHLLLSLLRDNGHAAAHILLELDVTLDRLRAEVLKAIGADS